MSFAFALTVVIKTTIVLLTAASISLALRKAAASIRHVTWTAGLVSVLLLPILSLQLPTLELRVLPPLAPSVSPATMPAITAIPRDIVSGRGPSLSRMNRSSPMQWNTTEMLFFAWLAGAALVGVRSAVGFLMIRRLLKHATTTLV